MAIKSIVIGPTQVFSNLALGSRKRHQNDRKE